jgi:hypothetical protein
MDVIAKARALIENGQEDDARDLLLDEGYIQRSDAKIQKAFVELVPISKTLATILEERYRGIDDDDPKIRFRAVAAVNRELCRQTLRNNVFWMRDPRAVDPLAHAATDRDAKVLERALIAVAHVVAYFPDRRLADLALANLSSPKPKRRALAIAIVSGLRNEELLAQLAPVFERGTPADRNVVLSSVWGHFLPESTLRALRPYLPVIRFTGEGRALWKKIFLAALAEEDVTTRKQAVHALHALGDEDTLPSLEAVRRKERDENILYFLDQTIEGIRRGETWSGQ